MRRCAILFTLSACLMANCAVFKTREPVDLDSIVKEHCDEDAMDPKELRNLPINMGVRSSQYERAQAAHHNCEMMILRAAVDNGEIAKHNAGLVNQAYKEGLWTGAGLLAAIEAGIAFALR